MPDTRVAVVGAGLGGLAAAARLAHAGCRVEVFEQAAAAGGKAGEVRDRGFRFDTGPTLLTMPFVFDALYADLGERREDHLRFLPLDPTCAYHWPDGTRFAAPARPEDFAREAERVFGEPARSVRRLLDHARGIYDATAELFLFDELWAAARRAGPRALRAVPRLDALRTMHAAHASFLRDPRLVQLFDRYATFNGSDPFRAPATLAIIPWVEHGLGAFAMEGGVRALPVALERLAARHGARVRLGARVQEVLVDGGKVQGVRVDGEKLPFDAVVVNADVLTAYRTILAALRDPLARRYERLEPSSSGLAFLWGVASGVPGLRGHSIFFSGDYRAEFDSIFRRRTCPRDPTVYLSAASGDASKGAQGDAPKGAQSWFVLVNAPCDAGQDWAEETRRTRAAVLKRLSASLEVNVEPMIRVEHVLGPPDVEARTGSARGSLYGIASNARTAAFMRHPNRHPRVGGLYFCGGSAHPGGGMPLVTLSGAIAARALLSDIERSRP